MQENPNSIDNFLRELTEQGTFDGFNGPVPNSLVDSLSQSPIRDKLDENLFGIEISTARFGVKIIHSPDKSLRISFPSHKIWFDIDELEEIITRITTVAFPNAGYKPTPLAYFTREETEERFDLKSAWDFRKYEKALSKDNFLSLYYRINPPTLMSNPNLNNTPNLIHYGFRRPVVTDPEYSEFIEISAHRALGPSGNVELFKEVLHRHKDYLGRNNQTDAEDFVNQVRNIAKEEFPQVRP